MNDTPRFALRLDHGVLPPSGGPVKSRRAARAVVPRAGQLLMVHSTVVGDWKFPGGGVEGQETPEQALDRELREETGYAPRGRLSYLGRVVERAEGREVKGSLFEMESRYFLVQVDDQPGALRLDDYERDLGFTPKWVALEEALEANRRLQTSGRVALPPWLAREILVLKWLKDNL